MDAKRYSVVQQGQRTFLVSPSSAAILKALSAGSQYSYEELGDETGLPTNSLYVFCQRLEKHKLIRRVKRTDGSPRRVRTIIKLRMTGGLKFPTLSIIR